jgi:hypothetical protein
MGGSSFPDAVFGFFVILVPRMGRIDFPVCHMRALNTDGISKGI